MYAPTAAGASELRFAFAKAKITRTSPAVAATSENPWARVARWSLESEIADLENIKLARIAPLVQPATCTTRYQRAVRQEIPPNAASTKEIMGLKWAPEIGPSVAVMTYRPSPVAAA